MQQLKALPKHETKQKRSLEVWSTGFLCIFGPAALLKMLLHSRQNQQATYIPKHMPLAFFAKNALHKHYR